MEREKKENCTFCKILSGEYESSLVFEDDLVAAFLDIQPVNPGHVLIIPKEHIVELKDIPEKVAARMFNVGQKVTEALKSSGILCEGVNLFLADGEEAGQEVWHSHLHAFPRFKNDGFGLKHSEEYFNKPSRDELQSVADRIKSHLN